MTKLLENECGIHQFELTRSDSHHKSLTARSHRILLSLLSWGKRYLLKVIEADAAPEVALKHSQILLKIRPATSDTKKEAILAQWYRDQLKQAVLPLIVEWEPLIGVEVRRFFVQRMKTNWGSCNTEMGNIRLNTDLAKKPGE